jgi:hypothetical protein
VLLFLFPAVDKVKDQGDDDADQNTRGNGKIEIKILLLHADVAGELAEKWNLVMISHDNTGDNENESDDY